MGVSGGDPAASSSELTGWRGPPDGGVLAAWPSPTRSHVPSHDGRSIADGRVGLLPGATPWCRRQVSATIGLEGNMLHLGLGLLLAVASAATTNADTPNAATKNAAAPDAVPSSAYCSDRCTAASAHCQTPCYDDGAGVWSTCQASGEGWNAPLWTNVTHQVQEPVRALHGTCGDDFRAAKIDRYWQEDACGVYPDRFVCYFTSLNSCESVWDLELPWCPFCGFNKPCPE